MIEQYITEATAFFIGVGTGIIVRAKLWWTTKSDDERKELIADIVQSLADGRITTSEAKALIIKYL